MKVFKGIFLYFLKHKKKNLLQKRAVANVDYVTIAKGK